MFNENQIKENQVCFLDGKAQVLSDVIFRLEISGRKTIRVDELKTICKQACIEYEKAWNKWADYAHIGGGRFDETGNQRSKK